MNPNPMPTMIRINMFETFSLFDMTVMINPKSSITAILVKTDIAVTRSPWLLFSFAIFIKFSYVIIDMYY